MGELLYGNEEIYIIVYCFILLWLNLDYIKDYKKIKTGLSEISSDAELEVNPEGLSMVLIDLLFNFFRRWLLYILAVLMTGNIFVVIVSVTLFAISLYDVLFNCSLAKLKKSNLKFYLAGLDTIYVSIFVSYLLLS
ncbi:hypothetical protein [Mesobacillus selenatarsenatis]|uniref:Uncharacterized protein n=1 Tax=Mesobacillus selenatarsenatis TaxID=388741 RepID=A0A846TNR4_9BACI|nr:hypothetical protein [Mesobacillus selenatarsenatis]NKE04071.1 hypothetical protein [Mesobacillus selenatarsenatis]